MNGRGSSAAVSRWLEAIVYDSANSASRAFCNTAGEG